MDKLGVLPNSLAGPAGNARNSSRILQNSSQETYQKEDAIQIEELERQKKQMQDRISMLDSQVQELKNIRKKGDMF